MSQKQRFHHNNLKPTPPEGGWAPAYTNLNNQFFSYLVNALKEGHISPSDEAAEVYNKNPFLWPIHPYKFTHFFQKASAASASASMSTLLDDKESTIFLSQSSLALLQSDLSRSSLPPDTILGKSCEQPPESKHKFSQSQSHPTIPRSAVPMCGTQFNASGSPVTGTPMASIESFRQAHQIPLTNGRFQFKIVPLHSMTSNNTYMYQSQSDHKLWFIYYMLEKRANPVEVARKLTKGDHNIVSNGKVLYPNLKISKVSELVTTTRSHIMDVHGQNPKGVTTSCFYMIVEFEEPMLPNLITYDAGQGKILPKMFDIVNQEATWDDDTGELVFNLQTEARFNTTLNNSDDEDTEEEEDR
jgi:hypothetical protein